ncbi:MAG: hypothetical protein HQ543_11660 [Bacteroidetes bacterium]|nr:hypothetical protein [Bacteroidota bacterium]
MNKSITFILFLIISNSVILAQRTNMCEMEVLVGGGPNMFFCDIGDGGLGPVGFIAARYYVKDNIAARLNLAFAIGIDTDEGTTNFDRDYSFKTLILESTALIDYFFYRSDFEGRQGKNELVMNVPRLGLYAFTGAGSLFFNPAPEAENGTYDFDDDYSKISMVVPFGLGMQYGIDKKWSASFEVGRRFTPSDFLDGFSPDASKNKDVYYFALISVNYKFKSFL